METYEIIECLYQSHSSSIYKARCHKDLNLYILKVFIGKTASAQNEIKMLRAVQIDFVVKYKEILEISDGLVLVMEYCDSGSLENFIKEHMGNTISERMVYVLLYMHNKDIIHHALTPDNIFLTRTMKGEQLRIGDFGKGSVGSNNHQLPQQARYLPPEYLQEGIFDQKSQLWQMGLVLYELASQKSFFSPDDTEDSIRQKLTKGQLQVKIPSIYSRQLKRVIQLCLDADAQYRLQLRHIINNPSRFYQCLILFSDFQAILKRNPFEFSFEQQAFIKEQIKIIMVESGKRTTIITKDESFSPIMTQKQPGQGRRGTLFQPQTQATGDQKNIILQNFLRTNSKNSNQQFSVSTLAEEKIEQVAFETPKQEKKSQFLSASPKLNIINYNTPSQAYQVNRYKSMQQIKEFLNTQTPTQVIEPIKQKTTVTRFFRRPATQVNIMKSNSDRNKIIIRNKSQNNEKEEALQKIDNLIKQKFQLCVQAVGEPQTNKLLQLARLTQSIEKVYQEPIIFNTYSSSVRADILSHIKDITELDEEYKILKNKANNFI